ncbi:MAG TPA: ComF family protein [Ignavibacteria bacterium]|nr:ComF family protein [Ignavibacteria bacterium]
MLSEIIDFIFPRISLISDKRIESGNKYGEYLNDEDLISIPKVTYDDLSELNDKLIADISFSHFSFAEGDEFSKIIYQLKYGGMKKLGIYLGEIIGHELQIILETNNITDFDYIIPVPLYKTKLRERGFNQSEYICMGIVQYLNSELVPDMIIRVRHTTTQTKLSREERISNLKNAFTINKDYKDIISGKRIIIVDDVVTTGSTMNEAIKVLKENNSSEVMACTLAMAR